MAKIRKATVPVPIPTVQQSNLSVPHVSQEWDNWCWAACTQMVVTYFHSGTVTQADIANRAFGRSDCGINPLCNLGVALLSPTPGIPSMQSVFAQWKVQADHRAGPVSFSDVQTEIAQESPVEVVYGWTSGGGHAVVVTGWLVAAGEEKLRINDPYYAGIGLTSYSSVLAAYGLGQWDDSFLLKKVI